MGKAGNPEDFSDGTGMGKPEGQKAGGAEAGSGLPTEYTENTEEKAERMMIADFAATEVGRISPAAS
jgi:hypothetical protein